MKLNTTDNSSKREQIKELWRYSFSDTEDFMSLYFGHYWQGKNAITALDDKKVIGALELVPYKLSLRGNVVDTSYIVGVSTAPEARGGGIASTLMRAAMEKQKERREVLSLLSPFSFNFYNKMGYAACYQEMRCHIPSERFPNYQYKGKFNRAALSDWNDLSTVYHQFCKHKNGYVFRQKEEWQFIFDMLKLAGGYLYTYQNEEGTTIAYVSFVKNAEHFQVIEAAYINPEGLQALLSFIGSHFSSYSHIDMTLPAGSPLPTLFGEPPVCELHPTVMGRILDIPRVLSAGLGGLRLGVSDDFCPENTGVYEENGGGIVRYDSLDCEIQTHIGALTQLVMGFRSAYDLSVTGHIIGDIDAIVQLDRLYPKQHNFINHILTDNI
ncbi:MAG: GNAT family N-acetyltransferase [Clostridia bacterium]|nr:GNAT family N-acetyltransferase [Clostridia bacterium]